MTDEAAQLPANMTIYYLGLLLKGPTWTAEETPAVLALQEAHLANIRRLADLGKLVIVGPILAEAQALRGVYIFRCESLEEAQALAASDPSIQAGRLVIEIYPWLVQKGVLA
jgi:uncharacterized protein YciI